MMPPDADPHIWKQVFGPLSQAIAFFGGLGGLVVVRVEALAGGLTAMIVNRQDATAASYAQVEPAWVAAIRALAA